MAGTETFDARRKAVDAAADWLALRARADASGGTSYALLVLPEEPLSAELRGKVDALIASGAQMGEAFLRLDVADGKDRYTEP